VVSTIDYSRRFTQILQTVLSSVLASVMVPALTGTFSKNNKIMFGNYFRQSLKMTLIINTAAVPFLFGAAAPICEYFYFRGQITQKIIENIIVLTRLYALTIPGISFVILFSLSLISQQQGKRCALMGMGIQLIMIVLNSFLFRILGEYIFSLTSFISHTVVGFLMLRLLDIEKKKDIVIEIVRYIIPAIVFSAVLINLNKLLPDYPALIRMCINAGVLAVFSFLVFQFFMKINIVAKVRILLFR
jgi:peptidoglycan biosynthesis protein MviN/MurJ (putative lipid II flippase)